MYFSLFVFTVTPSIIIQKIGPTSISVAISLPPSSAQFDLQHLQLSYKCEGAEDWTSVDHFDNVLGGTVVINNLSHGKRYTVKAVAVYPDDEKISSQEEPCDMPTEGIMMYHRHFFFFTGTGMMATK